MKDIGRDSSVTDSTMSTTATNHDTLRREECHAILFEEVKMQVDESMTKPHLSTSLSPQRYK